MTMNASVKKTACAAKTFWLPVSGIEANKESSSSELGLLLAVGVGARVAVPVPVPVALPLLGPSIESGRGLARLRVNAPVSSCCARDASAALPDGAVAHLGGRQQWALTVFENK